ncbi:four helix bundle protein [Acidithiobacillus caldus]
MAKIENFEDIEAWKKARELAKAIYLLSADGAFSRDFGLRDQIRRAAVSVLSNIAEGFERGGDVEFHRFLAIAKGSAGEVKAQLYIALDVGLINKEQFDELCGLATETASLIGGFMKYLKAPRSQRPRATVLY